MKEPLLILVVMVVILGFIYGPLKKANLNRNSTNTSESTISNTNGNSSISSNKDIAENIKQTETEIKALQKDTDEEIEKSKHSPYFGKISVSGVTGLYSDDPGREYISMYSYLDKNETVKITGWYFKSEVTGYFATIGKASLLPFLFTQTESDIILAQGDRVYLTKGFSPIGISFRTNICTGYFEENRTFTPSLPLQCPLPKDEKLPTFSSVYDRNDECLNVIDRISSCTTVDGAYLRDLPDTVPSSCKNYITAQVNYNACVALHFGDTDFPGNEYHVYLNKFGPLWRTTHDKINLYDENNLVVGTISY